MTNPRASILRRAISLLSVQFKLKQIGLALLVFALSAAWLRVPDASIFDVVASVLFAGLILVVVFAGEASLLLQLRRLPLTRARLVRGAFVLLLAVFPWILWSMLLTHLSQQDALRAGYLNSRFPPAMRNVFSFQHLLRWLGWMWTIFEWIGTGLLLAVAVASLSGARSMRSAVGALRCGTYWIVLFVSAALAAWVTPVVLNWTPVHGLRKEAISLVLRLGFVVVFDVGLACFVLAILTACLLRAEEFYGTPAGTPAASHPLTAKNP